MKLFIFILLLLTILLQTKLWFGKGGWLDVMEMQQTIAKQTEKNEALRKENQRLHAEVQGLKEGQDAIEERARSELGMIKKGEVFYQIIN